MDQQETLLSLKREIINELELLKEQIEPVKLDQQSVGRVSRIDAMQQHELAKSNHRHFELQLKKVEAALKRCESGDYGYCEECGDSIPAARLKIRPEARFCVKCQENAEKI